MEPGCWVPHLAVASPRTAARAKAAAAPEPKGRGWRWAACASGWDGRSSWVAVPSSGGSACGGGQEVAGAAHTDLGVGPAGRGRTGRGQRGADARLPKDGRVAMASSSAGRARGGRPPRLLLQHRVTGSPAGPVHARPCVLFLLSKLAVSCSPILGFKTNFYYNNLFILHLNYSVLKGHFKTPTALSLEEGVWSAGSSKMRTPLRTAGEDRARRQLPATQAPGAEAEPCAAGGGHAARTPRVTAVRAATSSP